jgi:hypothetical protein
MSEIPDERCAGVASVDHSDPRLPVPHCDGCALDGHGDNHGAPGKCNPGHTYNGRGRPHGRPNDTTIAANELLRAHAGEAAQVFVQGLRSQNDFVKYGAATKILERTMPRLPDGALSTEPPDVEWMEHLTDEEMEQLEALVNVAQRRMEAAHADAFSVDELPAPAIDVEAVAIEEQPALPAPEGDDEEEFG